MSSTKVGFRVHEAVDGDLGHLTDEVVGVEARHDGIDSGVPFVSICKLLAHREPKCGDYQRCQPRLEHLEGGEVCFDLVGLDHKTTKLRMETALVAAYRGALESPGAMVDRVMTPRGNALVGIGADENLEAGCDHERP